MNDHPQSSGMGIFLAYLLAGVFILIAFYILDRSTGDHWLTELIVTWLKIVVFFALGGGLLWAVWRRVRRW